MIGFFVCLSLSLHVDINGQEYDGDSLTDIIQKYGISKESVQTIHIISGDFNMDEFKSSEYENLASFELNSGCFNGKLTFQNFGNSIYLQKLILRGDISVDANVSDKSDNIEELYFSNLESIPDKSFYNATTLINITLHGPIAIPDYTFQFFTKLIYFYSNTINHIGKHAFECSGYLKEVHIVNATFIDSEAFRCCRRLEHIEMPHVKTIGPSAFELTDKLKTAIFPDVTNIENLAFLYSGIRNISILNVVNIGTRAFDATVAEITKLDNLISIGEAAFAQDWGLQDIEFPHLKVVGMNAFVYCDNLTSVNFGELEYISFGAFYQTKKLKNINIPHLKVISSTCFENCCSLETISCEEVTSISKWAFCRCCNLRTINFPNVNEIGRDAFSDCSSLSYVNFPSLVYLNESAFSNCSDLTTVVLENVISIGDEAFKDCKSLKNVTFNNLKNISGSAFLNCESLTYLDLSSVLQMTGDSVFENCTSLETIILSNLSVVDPRAEDTFSHCYSLKNIYFGDKPPDVFNSIISFKGIEIHVPYLSSWLNYIPQSREIGPSSYDWHGFIFNVTSPSPTPTHDNHKKAKIIFIAVSVSGIVILIIFCIFGRKRRYNGVESKSILESDQIESMI
ncbi:surface antigen BspA-like [Trichomonas vaginalis G3]|uniref:Surface antigen BspA-like n=1 Tax=Trichomonas vaginalis (strain ATCC PRA-98 / G3) TaxID=412133 RepID=A2EX16_TRIV3|nr:antigen BSP-related family [Trichomonas vaginalis G3]EAY02793.1 surface antigen BspA-like [Trichomonas vaginalis G3]KAI5537560.1 antigen BSP-related family [Trichomonas vaginalis G3]|eukprot:XP_001315016.1 surface antigen BspA-like [Trichomonas vaginalis G3]